MLPANQIIQVLPDGSRVMNFRPLVALAVLPAVCFAESPAARLAPAPPKIIESSPDTLPWQSASPATAVEVWTPDGQTFRSHLLGIAYTDPVSGRSVLIAEPHDCVGTIASPDRVVWDDALTDLKASIRLTYSKAGLEHDVVLLESPRPPGAFGLPDNSGSSQEVCFEG
jgi:hypothetical protein